MDISATENAKGGCSGHNHKLWVGDGSIHVCMYVCIYVWVCDALLRFNSI